MTCAVVLICQNLLGHIDQATAALADLLQQLVGTDPVASLFGRTGTNRES